MFTPIAFLYAANFFCNGLHTFSFDTTDTKTLFNTGIDQDYGLFLTEQKNLIFTNSVSGLVDFKTGSVSNSRKLTNFSVQLIHLSKNEEINSLNLYLNTKKSIYETYPNISNEFAEKYLNNVQHFNSFLKTNFIESAQLVAAIKKDGFSINLSDDDFLSILDQESNLIKNLMLLNSMQFLYVSTVLMFRRPSFKFFIYLFLNDSKYRLQNQFKTHYNLFKAFGERVYDLKKLIVKLYTFNESLSKDVTALIDTSNS